MKTHPVKSVFFKLMTAYLVAFFIIAGGAALVKVFSASSRNMDISAGNLHHYAALLADEIGSPPDFSKAREIAWNTDLQITITGRGTQWSSSGDLLIPEESFLQDDDFLNVFPGIEEPSIEIVRSGYHFSFSDFHADRHMSFIIWLIMSIAVTLALVVSYFMVHHQLKPLRDMYEIALEFGVSDWKKRASPRGSDELATLARAMNSMADRIEEYILSMHDLLIAVSHELRSPLTRMKVALEFIEDKKARESLGEEIEILDRMTGTLLEQRRLSSQQGILNLEEVNLHSWIDEICRPYIAGETSLTLSYKGPEKSVLLDKSRMAMALRNLIENSLRHAPGSPIHVSLTVPGTSGLTLCVSDEGPGIPDQMLSRIGEPFLLGDSSRTGRRSGGGFGLGLSIVKAVAAAHGASFKVSNLTPRGLEVRIKFP